jgi:putative ABC transport system substrate-binding protein
MMDGRALIAGTLALLGTPLAAGAEQPGRVFRIGLLGSVPVTDPEGARQWGAFNQGLRDLGYVEGQNIRIEWRVSEGRHPNLAAELVRLKVDVIVAGGTPAALGAKQATGINPVVAVAMGNPVGDGLIAGLARPGGNITGSTFLGPELAAKRLSLLKEAVPGSLEWLSTGMVHTASAR